MAGFTKMAFIPATGLNNKDIYPSTPDSEAEARAQVQGISDQLRDYINTNLVEELENMVTGSSGAERIGSAAIENVTGTTVREQIADLKGQIDDMATGSVSDGAITTQKIANSAVTQAKMAANAVGASQLADGVVSQSKLASGAVSAAKLADGSVNEVKIANSAVTSGKIATSAVTETKLSTSAVTSTKLGSGAVTETKLGTGAVTNAKIADGAVTADKISPGVMRLNGSNTAVGDGALSHITNGNANTALGWNALVYNNEGYYNTALGFLALDETMFYQNSTGLGANSDVSGSNQVQLGDSATTVYAFGAVQARSDLRDKANVEDTALGLEFIMALRPRQFRWDYREDYEKEAAKDGSKKRIRLHQGFVAQEVKQTMDALNTDFGGYQDHSIKGGKDVLSLGYAEFIAPLVKAIQQQQAMIERLQQQLKAAEA
ncbi:MAG: tail fiber domain-containing protein [Christensenellales bacterium]|jgi:hypothetical protein